MDTVFSPSRVPVKGPQIQHRILVNRMRRTVGLALTEKLRKRHVKIFRQTRITHLCSTRAGRSDLGNESFELLFQCIIL